MFQAREYMASLRQMLGRAHSPSEDKVSRKKKADSPPESTTSKADDSKVPIPLPPQDKKANKKLDHSRDVADIETVFSGGTDKSSGGRSRSSEMPLRKIARNFLLEFSNGVMLQSASSKGVIQDIFIRVSDTQFAWGFVDDRNQVVIPFKEIGRVQAGLPSQMMRIYPEELSRRAFHLILKDKPMAATFLAADEKSRDAILTGFHAVLELCVK